MFQTIQIVSELIVVSSCIILIVLATAAFRFISKIDVALLTLDVVRTFQ